MNYLKEGTKVRCLDAKAARAAYPALCGSLKTGKVYEVGAHGRLRDGELDYCPFLGGEWESGFGPESLVTEHDVVEFPAHYSLVGVDEVIDKIRGDLTTNEFRGYCKGNILKYVLRAAKKNGEEDWKKAAKYFTFMYDEKGDDE